MAYDNSKSDIEAVNVQDAIDNIGESLNVLGKEYGYIYIRTTGIYNFPFDLSDFRYLHVLMETTEGYVLSPTMMPLCVLNHDKYYAFSYYDGNINPFIAFRINSDKTVHCSHFNVPSNVTKAFLVLVK